MKTTMRNEMMYDTQLLEALGKRLEGDVAIHEANIRVYMNNPVGIGEHPQLIAAIEEEVEKLTEAADKLATVRRLVVQ